MDQELCIIPFTSSSSSNYGAGTGTVTGGSFGVSPTETTGFTSLTNVSRPNSVSNYSSGSTSTRTATGTVGSFVVSQSVTGGSSGIPQPATGGSSGISSTSTATGTVGSFLVSQPVTIGSSGIVQPATDGSTIVTYVVKLEQFLKTYIASNSSNIPAFVRASFHDLLTLNPSQGTAGNQGCLVDDARINGFDQNKGLQPSVDLVNAVRQKFPDLKVNTGDIISLAGKVAVETAYPCMKIGWNYGRPACNPIGNDRNDGPESSISSVAEYQVFSDRYGLTVEEMLLLSTGGHALAGSVNRAVDTGISDFMYASANEPSSPITYIQRMMTPNWSLVGGGSWYQSTVDSALGRFPCDFFIYPTTLADITDAPVDNSNQAAQLEQLFTNFATTPTGQKRFMRRFAAAYEKMLNVGTSGLTVYSLTSTDTC